MEHGALHTNKHMTICEAVRLAVSITYYCALTAAEKTFEGAIFEEQKIDGSSSMASREASTIR